MLYGHLFILYEIIFQHKEGGEATFQILWFYKSVYREMYRVVLWVHLHILVSLFKLRLQLQKWNSLRGKQNPLPKFMRLSSRSRQDCDKKHQKNGCRLSRILRRMLVMGYGVRGNWIQILTSTFIVNTTLDNYLICLALVVHVCKTWVIVNTQRVVYIKQNKADKVLIIIWVT